MERALGELSDAYKTGSAHKVGRAARLCLTAGAAVIAARAGRSRSSAVVGGLLVNAGALLARWSVYKAGFQSARDPKYIVGPQRARLAARAGAAEQVQP